MTSCGIHREEIGITHATPSEASLRRCPLATRAVARAHCRASCICQLARDNSISFAGADIKVVAQDPDKMARDLAAWAKLKRLVIPAKR